MVEKCFRGWLWWFGDIREYIGERIRSGGSQGAHKGGSVPYPPGHALRPCARLVAPPTSSPSLLVVFWSKKNHREGFIPFGIPFLRNTKTRRKQELALGSRLIS